MSTKDQRPHSRACGIRRHEHGTECHSNCPTCGGKASPPPSPPEPSLPQLLELMKMEKERDEYKTKLLAVRSLPNLRYATTDELLAEIRGRMVGHSRLTFQEDGPTEEDSSQDGLLETVGDTYVAVTGDHLPPQCCYLDNATPKLKQCEKKATLLIMFDSDPYHYSESCSAHVEDLLEDGKHANVFSIQDTNAKYKDNGNRCPRHSGPNPSIHDSGPNECPDCNEYGTYKKDA